MLYMYTFLYTYSYFTHSLLGPFGSYFLVKCDGGAAIEADNNRSSLKTIVVHREQIHSFQFRGFGSNTTISDHMTKIACTCLSTRPSQDLQRSWGPLQTKRHHRKLEEKAANTWPNPVLKYNCDQLSPVGQ